MTSALQYRNIAEMSNCCTTNIVIFGYCDLILRCRTEPKGGQTLHQAFETHTVHIPLKSSISQVIAKKELIMGHALLRAPFQLEGTDNFRCLSLLATKRASCPS